MNFFRALSISNKLLVIILPIIVLSFVLLGQTTTVKVKTAVREETVRQLNSTVASLSDMVIIANESILRDADVKMNSLLQHYRGKFSVEPGSKILVGGHLAPVLRCNGAPVNLNFSQVDDFSRQNDGSVATVFVRNGNDFIRVATSLKKEDGTRAIGTSLGSEHPAYAGLMRGEFYHGQAKLFGHYYMTKYLPIRDAGNAVIGVLFVGTNIDNIIAKLEKTVYSVQVGKSGYAYVLNNGTTKSRGEFVMHPDKSNIGKNVLEFRDAKGKEFFKEMLEAKSGYITYWWKNSGEANDREKFAIFMTVPTWDWLIVCSGYTEELYAAANHIQSYILFASLILAVILAALIVTLIHKFLEPLKETACILEKIAEGDLTVQPTVASNDEIGSMQRACQLMVTRLNDILRKTAANASQVASAASQMHVTSEQMSTGMEQVVAQSMSVATAGEEMAATSGDIARNCLMVAEGSKQANATAENGARVVESTISGMARIAERVKASAQTIENLGVRSDQIGEIIGTIEDIADQTNLLALNAAIEAARAGEQGRGFAVVADEVRALAERTTKATREIDKMIKAIQNETRQAVSAMEDGVTEVERGTAEAARSGTALGDILDQINAVNLQVNQIATAAEEQTATTSEISYNMQQITEVVRGTSQGAQNSAAAAAQLTSLSEDLQRLVGQFKLAS